MRSRLPAPLAAGVGDQPVGGPRGHPQPALDLRGGLAGVERDRDLVRGPDALAHPVQEARQPLPLAAQRQVQARGGGRVPAQERVGERPGPVLGRRRGQLVDRRGVDARAGAGVQRELLELAQQPLLPVADVGDQRPRGVGLELETRARGR